MSASQVGRSRRRASPLRACHLVCETACVLATACLDAPMNYMAARGPVADSQAKLGWWCLVISILVVVVIGILVLVASIRSRGRGQPHEVARTARNAGLSWIYVGGLLVPAILLVLTFAFTLGSLHAVAAPAQAPAATIQVIGHRWWWEVRYPGGSPAESFVTANEIHVPVGKPVRLELSTADVIHSFWIPKLAGKTDLNPGATNVAWIQADSAGVYRGQCTEYCGVQHANMAAFVIADPPVQYAAWVRTQRDSAQPPGDSTAAAGRAVFEGSACASCHAIRGTRALGRVGPDLTHVASRLTLAAGTLENTRGNLAGWIADAQALKPGNDMPTVRLSPADLHALVTYLESLK
ncbi:MAG TPA: cytochrome c oxidase subunit II [Gemmatimonadaceae bacterium]|nr:cytochrome c oxidase subunit II [Gemmatimonadaceae bacterium]